MRGDNSPWLPRMRGLSGFCVAESAGYPYNPHPSSARRPAPGAMQQVEYRRDVYIEATDPDGLQYWPNSES